MAQPVEPKKVLRIGIIMDGKIVQERLIKAGDPVTVGEAPKNTFVLPKLPLPRQDFPLFGVKSGKYYLAFTEHMKGKVGSGGAVVGLDKLRTDPTIEKEGIAWRLPLNEQDRGKIQIENVTVLFQFVSAPPTAAIRPPRMDFRPRLVEEDDALLFGFLVLFGAMGAIFVIWARFFTSPEEEGVAPLEEKWVKLIIPEAVPVPDVVSDIGEQKVEEKAEKAEDHSKEASQNPGDKPKAPATKGDVLKKSAVLQYLTTRGESGEGTAKDMWSEVGNGDAMKASLDGTTGTVSADEGNLGLHGGTAGGPGGNADIGDVGKIGTGDGGKVKVSDVRTLTVTASEATEQDVEEGDPAKIRDMVKRYSGQLRYCYEDRLKVDPNLSGRVEITFSVNGGRVSSAEVFANTTGDAEFGQCIVSKIKRWAPPAEVKGEFTFPFVFKQKT